METAGEAGKKVGEARSSAEGASVKEGVVRGVPPHWGGV